MPKISLNSTVEWESSNTKDRMFRGRVRSLDATHAVVIDERKRWKPAVMRLSRLTYIKPSLVMRK